ncbi:hypothetical protein DXK33_07680 [Mycolicibacterium neoaurum]|nr:hypothetical protein DXK33_07680 [Mycolicibacterium neoaurum]
MQQGPVMCPIRRSPSPCSRGNRPPRHRREIPTTPVRPRSRRPPRVRPAPCPRSRPGRCRPRRDARGGGR